MSIETIHTLYFCKIFEYKVYFFPHRSQTAAVNLLLGRSLLGDGCPTNLACRSRLEQLLTTCGSALQRQHRLVLGCQSDATTLCRFDNALVCAGLLGEDGTTLDDLGVRVELDESALVDQRVEATLATEDGLVGRTQNLANLVGLEETGQIGVGHLGLGQVVALLLGGVGLPGSEQIVQTVEGRLGPDDEAADMTAGSELQQVQLGHGNRIDAGDVAERLAHALSGKIKKKQFSLEVSKY